MEMDNSTHFLKTQPNFCEQDELDERDELDELMENLITRNPSIVRLCAAAQEFAQSGKYFYEAIRIHMGGKQSPIEAIQNGLYLTYSLYGGRLRVTIATGDDFSANGHFRIDLNYLHPTEDPQTWLVGAIGRFYEEDTINFDSIFDMALEWFADHATALSLPQQSKP
jgi:hypothetical protein